MFAETAVGIVIFRLFRKIEGSVGSGVVAHASQVHPVSVIAAGVVVDQKLLEMPGTGQPILPQIVNQVGSYVLPPPVAHPSGPGQFDHVGIDEIIRGPASFPLFEGTRVTPPACGFSRSDTPGPKDFRTMRTGHETEKLAPE